MAYKPTNPNGQATMANSEPVVIASDQSAVPVSATNLDIRDLSSASDSVAAAQSGTWNITNVSGTVSLPTGAATLAEQQTQTASLSVLDDWDESDRAKVNIIAGQVGVAGGSGGVSALTQRVVLATDVGLPAGTSNIGDVDIASIAGTISTNNSTTSVLSGGAAFTGTADEITNVGSIRVSVIASHASATDGLSLQQSSNGTNWDITDVYTIAATTGRVFVVNPVARYFRIVYTNGATLQTSFRLQVIYSPLATIPSSQRPSDARTNEVDLEETASFLMGYNGTTWDRLRSDTTNGLDVDVTRVSGQSLTFGAGSVAAGTQRVTHASDDPVTTSLQLIDDGVYTDDTSTHSTGTSKGYGMMAVADPTDAAVNANDFGHVAMNTSRFLKVIPQANSGVDIGDVDVLSVVAGTGATNLGKARDSAIGATDTGVAMLGVRRDTPTAETPAAGDYVVPQISANGEQWVRLAGELADDAAFTVGTTRVVPAGLLADETSPDSVDEGDIGIPRMTLDRKAISTLYPSSTTGDGLLVANFNTGDTFTALTNSAQVIKATAGNFYGYYIYNPNAAATYVMLYNVAAASVTVGTTTPAMVFCIPATSGANLSLAYPIPFTNAGWSIAAATTGGGNTAPTTALECMIFYK